MKLVRGQEHQAFMPGRPTAAAGSSQALYVYSPFCGTCRLAERMLARALMGDPELLIKDEPCSGLDIYEREKLLQDMALLSGLST
ncbi:hypothetical protein [Paenibacillus popilliae]|uniref:ATPase component/photorepair protein PhrA n=1 Tax=Paenibacillus popilliae ATCC 14706 TaxID=1212764 RepID=M9M0Z4_PAEPP|nr:hypothetical protein [Paenibacillus popilliae]GAC40718.1 ATPase component/photorepair protein PhrA [Paenibacillus popilliae ATCC 14706]